MRSFGEGEVCDELGGFYFYYYNTMGIPSGMTLGEKYEEGPHHTGDAGGRVGSGGTDPCDP